MIIDLYSIVIPRIRILTMPYFLELFEDTIVFILRWQKLFHFDDKKLVLYPKEYKPHIKGASTDAKK